VELFFNKGGPTRKVWYYQLELGSNLGKTNLLNDGDLVDFIDKQKTFADSDKSWSVDVADIDRKTFDLSVKNPDGGEAIAHRSPREIMEEIAALAALKRSLLHPAFAGEL
jgi:type I restriction enzyme M protein